MNANIVPRVPVPAWANAGYILSFCDYDPIEFVTTGGTQELVLPSDAGRWAVGFTALNTPSTAVRVSCWGDAQQYGQQVGSGNLNVWFTLFDFGPMTTFQWYAWSASPEPIIIHRVTYRG